MAWFGNTVTGANSIQAPPANDKAASKFALAFDGTITSVTMVYSGGRTAGARAVIYDSTGVGGLPGALLGVSNELATGPTAGVWYKYTFPSGIHLTAAGGPYWLGIWSGTVATCACLTLTNGIAFNVNTYSSTGNPSNPFGASPSQTGSVYPIAGVYTPDFITSAPNSYAGYPALADPSGTSLFAPSANQMVVFPISVSGGQIDSITWQTSAAASGHVKAVVYDATGAGGTPGTLLGTSSELTNPAAGLNTATFATGVPVSGTVYIGLHADVNLSTFGATLPSGSAYSKPGATYSSGPPSTFGTPTTVSNGINIWANSTAGFVAPIVNMFGDLAAKSSARLGPVSLSARLGGRLKTQSSATAWLPATFPSAGRIATASSGRLLQPNAILLGARMTMQSKARGLMYLQAGAYRAQWGVTVNSG